MKTVKINKIKWIKPIHFWRYKFVWGKFDAILLVQHKNPPYENGYECLSIFRFSQKSGIGINACLADFKFGDFNPEKNYKKIAFLEYQS